MVCLGCNHYTHPDREMERVQGSENCRCACHPWNKPAECMNCVLGNCLQHGFSKGNDALFAQWALDTSRIHVEVIERLEAQLAEARAAAPEVLWRGETFAVVNAFETFDGSAASAHLTVPPGTPSDHWYRQANCQGTPTSLYFPDHAHSVAADAQALCDACPVRYDCLADTLAHESGDIRHGHNAATTRADRKRITAALARHRSANRSEAKAS